MDQICAPCKGKALRLKQAAIDRRDKADAEYHRYFVEPEHEDTVCIYWCSHCSPAQTIGIGFVKAMR